MNSAKSSTSSSTVESSPPNPLLEIGKSELLRALEAAAERVLRPPPSQTVSEWADAERVLSSEASAEPGRWRTDRTPYLRDFMNSFLDPDVTDTVGVFASQTGKTEALNNVIGYFIHRDPCPILMVQPTLSLASSWSKLRLVPMLRDSPSLREIVGDPLSKKTGQEILEKAYPGGQIAIAGANAPGGLAGRPRRVVLGDELDRWPPSAGAEGDPAELARKRTSTYWNRVHGWISSPGTAGQSQIWDLWERSDKRRYFVPCHSCSEMQPLRWANVKWDKEADEAVAVASARYECDACGADWDDADRNAAVSLGEWRKQRETGNTAGFHLSALYSPWIELSDLVLEWIQSQGQPEKLKVFVNTRLAELWEEATSSVDLEDLVARREEYDAEAPAGVLVVTVGVDVQDDRLELETVGWGRRGESWSLDYRVLYGDPESMLDFDGRDPDADSRLVDELSRVFKKADGARLRVSATCIDSGGHHTQAVYKFAKKRATSRVYAIKGRAGEGVPLWPPRAKRSSRKGVGRVTVQMIGVDTGKSQLFHRLAKTNPTDPGYCHFPERPVYDAEYFAQLTGEALGPVKYVRGRKLARLWKQVHPRVEALDCRNYAQAALASLSPNWDRIEELLAKIRGEKSARDATAESKLEPAPKGGELADKMEREFLRRRKTQRGRARKRKR